MLAQDGGQSSVQPPSSVLRVRRKDWHVVRPRPLSDLCSCSLPLWEIGETTINPIQKRNIMENRRVKAQRRSCSDELLGEFQEVQKMKVMLQRSLGTLSMTSERQQNVRSLALRELFPGTSALFRFLLFCFLFHSWAFLYFTSRDCPSV